MNLQTLLTFTTLCLAAAESSVVSLFIFDADPQSLVGSVVASNSDTTTYSINCASGVGADNCGFAPGFMYTAAPTMADWKLAPPYDIDGHVDCSMGGTTTAVCTLTMPHQVIGSSRTELTQVTTLNKHDITFMPVTITAGPSATATGASTIVTPQASTTITSQASGASSSSGTSTGGLPQITANPRAILGGAAAALVAAVL